MHQRQVIREAIKATLVDVTTAEGRVSTSRLVPYRVRNLPAIDIVTVGDNIDPASLETSPREHQHTYSVAVRGWVGVTDAVDDVMDALAKQIETALNANRYLSGAAAKSDPIETDFDFKADGDRDLGVVSLFYNATYVDRPDDASPVDNFNTATATHNLGNAVHEDEQPADNFTVQE